MARIWVRRARQNLQQHSTRILLIQFYGLALLRSVKGIVQLYQTYSVPMYYQYTAEYFLAISYPLLLILVDSIALKTTFRVTPMNVILLLLLGVETYSFLTKSLIILSEADLDNPSASRLNADIRTFSITVSICMPLPLYIHDFISTPITYEKITRILPLLLFVMAIWATNNFFDMS